MPQGRFASLVAATREALAGRGSQGIKSAVTDWQWQVLWSLAEGKDDDVRELYRELGTVATTPEWATGFESMELLRERFLQVMDAARMASELAIQRSVLDRLRSIKVNLGVLKCVVAKGPAQPKDIATDAAKDRSQISKALAVLEHDGLIRRTGRKPVFVTATYYGRKALDQVEGEEKQRDRLRELEEELHAALARNRVLERRNIRDALRILWTPIPATAGSRERKAFALKLRPAESGHTGSARKSPVSKWTDYKNTNPTFVDAQAAMKGMIMEAGW